MATSGTATWNPSRNQIVRSALRKVNAIASGSAPSAQQLSDANHALNAMVKSLQATGMHIWTETEGVLFPVAEQSRYGLGGGATDRVAGPFTQTTVSVDADLGDSTIAVASTTGISASDNLGVVLADGTIQWTTVSSKTSTTITLAATLTDAVADGAAVFAYTSLIVRPLKIVAARRYDILSGNETPIDPMSRSDYFDLPRKAETGAINQFFYDPQLGTGYLYLWQPPTVVDELVKFTWWRPIEDFNAAGDNADLPQEWIAALEWGLAQELSTEYPVSDRVYRRIVMNAERHLDNVSGFDREETSIRFEPARS